MPEASAERPEFEEEACPPSKAGSKLEELRPIGTALAALGGGIGALGVVAFFGAASLWVRMDQVGIPANEAIAVVPKSVLVTTGASFLVPSVLLAVVLLGVLYPVERFARELAELRFLRKLPIESTEKGIQFFLIAIVLVVAAIPGVLLSAVGLQEQQIEYIAVAVLFLSAICLVVFANMNFVWFALAIVVAVCLLNGFVTYLRTKNDPKVEPAAVLRLNGPPLYGFFVAQTSDRIYLATRLPTGPLRLDAIPREEVTDMAVGDDLRRRPAEIRARLLARQMCVVARERAQTGQTVATAPRRKTAAESCTVNDLRRLTGSRPKAGPALANGGES